MPLTSSIKSKAIDAGQNFLTGQITNVFAARGLEVSGKNLYELADNIQMKAMDVAHEVENGAMTMISSAGAGLGSSFGNVVGAGLALAGDVTMMSDLAQEAVSDVAKHALSYLNKKTSELATTVPSYFTSRVTYWSAKFLQEELSNIPKKFLSDADEKAKEDALKQKEKGPKDITKTVSDTVSKVTSYVDKYVSYLTKYTTDITNYACMGPQWVAGQIGTLQDTCEEKCDQFISKQADAILKKRNNELDGVAKGVAKHTVQATIKSINKKIDKLANSTNKNIAKVKGKALTQIQKAKYKLAGALGIPPL